VHETFQAETEPETRISEIETVRILPNMRHYYVSKKSQDWDHISDAAATTAPTTITDVVGVVVITTITTTTITTTVTMILWKILKSFVN